MQSTIFYNINIYASRIPLRSVPIGASPGGDIFLLDLRNNEFGRILYWRPERETEGCADFFYENIEVVSDSFSNFLTQFMDDDIVK